MGRAAYFEPKPVDIDGLRAQGLDDDAINAIRNRYSQRMDEYIAQAENIDKIKAQGMTLEDGVIKSADGKYHAGDNDLFDIRVRDPNTGQLVPAPKAVREAVIRDLSAKGRGPGSAIDNGPFRAQHSEHMAWEYDPAHPEHGAVNRGIDQTIVDSHARGPGGEPLADFGAGRAPTATYYDGPDATQLRAELAAQRAIKEQELAMLRTRLQI